MSAQSIASQPISALDAPQRQPRYVKYRSLDYSDALTSNSTDHGIVGWHARHYLRAIYAFPDFKRLLGEGGKLWTNVENGKVTVDSLNIQFVL